MNSSSEKFCLKWNGFEQNIVSSHHNLRKDSDFSDVTLVCEEDLQIEAHKVILAAHSPFFSRALKRNKHSHPMIYMRGITAKDLSAIVDFIYYGEANIYQEDLEGFLALAEELQLKGLAGPQENNLDAAQDQSDEPKHAKPQTYKLKKFYKITDIIPTESYSYPNIGYDAVVPVDAGKMLVAADTTIDDLKVKLDSMMEQANDGEHIWKCTVCGKKNKGKDAKRETSTLTP